MNASKGVPGDVRRIAAAQAGVVARSQLLSCGVSERSLDRFLVQGHWLRLAPGLYQIHTLAPSWCSLAWAGVLVGGPRAALRGISAARTWGLTSDEGLPVHILLPHGVRCSHVGWWEFRRTRREFRSIGSPPRLTLECTVLDLCAEEPDRCADWVTLGIGTRHTTAERIRRELEAQSRHPARGQLLELLADVRQGAQSPLELRYVRDVERAHKMTGGRHQVRSGSYVCDVLYGEGLVVELDGRRGHEGPDVFRDMDRDNFHQLRGLRTLRFGWQQCLAEPCRVAATVATVRHSLGWTGQIIRCRRCRAVPEGDFSRLLSTSDEALEAVAGRTSGVRP